VVERCLRTAEVRGSTPLTSTGLLIFGSAKPFPQLDRPFRLPLGFPIAQRLRRRKGRLCATMRGMIGRRQLPWILSMPLMVAGSVAAHSLGSALVASRVSATADRDGGVEVARRLDHGFVTSLPLFAGMVIALVLVVLGPRIHRRLRGDARPGASPASFLLLPPLAYTLQEVAERLLHAESFPFNPAHEPAFLLALVLQVPFGVIACFLGRGLLGLGRALARVLVSRDRRWPTGRPTSQRRLPETILLRTPVLALGHSVRGPPAAATSF
jgi:hypothetical protein